jgi:hypothetical protein
MVKKIHLLASRVAYQHKRKTNAYLRTAPKRQGITAFPARKEAAAK